MWTLLLSVAAAQVYEAQPCRPAPLAAQLEAGSVETLVPLGPTFGVAAASSSLAPPKSYVVDLEKLLAADGLETGDAPRVIALVEADARSCAYGPTNLRDGDVATAWCEGAPGPGVGEIVVFELPAGVRP